MAVSDTVANASPPLARTTVVPRTVTLTGDVPAVVTCRAASGMACSDRSAACWLVQVTAMLQLLLFSATVHATADADKLPSAGSVPPQPATPSANRTPNTHR